MPHARQHAIADSSMNSDPPGCFDHDLDGKARCVRRCSAERGASQYRHQ
jgi:hypothetical protein